MNILRRLIIICFLLCVVSCKSELYSGLDETEANQMQALLIYNSIPVGKKTEKNGITLTVDDDNFVDAVEILRQHGFPRKQGTTLLELFPSGQLVSSPEQEEAKLNFFKSQQLGTVLRDMDGVITAEVMVAQAPVVAGEKPGPVSAAVFIKHSPEVNLSAREAEIRELIQMSIPELKSQNVSILFQMAPYLYSQKMVTASADRFTIQKLAFSKKILLTVMASALVVMLISHIIWIISRRRRR